MTDHPIFCALVFLAGVALDVVCGAWLHYSERREPVHAASAALVINLIQVAGIGESIHDPHLGVWYVIGCGVGTFIAVEWKRRHPESP